jgi:hypothetical protein
MTIEKKMISKKSRPKTTKKGVGEGDDMPSVI